MKTPLEFVLVIRHNAAPFETFREIVRAFDVEHAQARFRLAYVSRTMRARDPFSGEPVGDQTHLYTLVDIEPFEYHRHTPGGDRAALQDRDKDGREW